MKIIDGGHHKTCSLWHKICHLWIFMVPLQQNLVHNMLKIQVFGGDIKCILTHVTCNQPYETLLDSLTASVVSLLHSENANDLISNVIKSFVIFWKWNLNLMKKRLCHNLWLMKLYSSVTKLKWFQALSCIQVFFKWHCCNQISSEENYPTLLLVFGIKKGEIYLLKRG